MSDDDRIAELEARIARLERDLAESRDLRREAVAARDAQTARLTRARERLDGLRRRRAVRAALAISDRSRPAVAAVRILVAGPRRIARSIRRRIRGKGGPRPKRASEEAERDLAKAIRSGLTRAALDGGPLVSIVILNRDGRRHLLRCLGAVATTHYRDIEIIVVDNGSTDGSPELAEALDLPFPVTVIRNRENRSFSEANDQGVAGAKGELICFLNNDVDPITPDWLGYMVETIAPPDVVAVGARLIYPRHRGGARGGARFADLSLQHRGVAFDRSEPVPLPRVMGAGEDPLSPAAVAVEERPALTAACLLVRRSAFDAVGGFATAYDYGLEDIDLCLNLRAAGGRLVYDGRAALWHHESATRAADPELRRARVAHNRGTFLDDWGPRIFREALLDALDGSDQFSSAPFHVAVIADDDHGASGGRVPATAGGLVRTLETLGWRVSQLASARGIALEPSVEAILVLDDAIDIHELPRRLVSIAWIGSEPGRWLERPWFDDYDIVLGSREEILEAILARSAKTATLVPAAPDGASVRDAIVAWASATRFGLRVGIPGRDVAGRWGDYWFARALQRALERAGHPTRLHLLPDWSAPVAAREDVTVHLLGLKEAPTRHSQVNLLWQISHPDVATAEMYERYDHVFVASDPFAVRMAGQARVPVTPLHQATDPDRFRPDPTGPEHELLFVGNSRNVRRRIVDDAVATGYDLAVYGARWRPDLIDPRFVKGERIPNDELRRYYSSAAIVLNDHWHDMRAEGFISNRLYDALACGAFVISDHIDGIEAEFDDAVVTYGDRDELKRLIERYLADPDERRRRGARGRAAVLERHTFDARAAVLVATATPLLSVTRSR
ncbi:MAG: glycosyltransferase [Chloroflexota bacterium]